MKNLFIFAKPLLAFAVLLTFSAPTLAQTPTARPMLQRRHLLKTLNLTADQKARIKSIRQNALAKRQALHSNTALTPKQKKAQQRAIAKSSLTQIRGVLTPEQMAKLKAARAARGKRGLTQG